MSDDNDTSPAAPEARSGWSEQDRRALIITIAGTLAANLATVLFVGAALALAHGVKGPVGLRVLVAVMVLAALGLAGVVIGNGARRGRLFGSAFTPPMMPVTSTFRVAYGWIIFFFGR
jgi:hypothetical protein